MSDLPPAGWYPDPSDETRQRYWDGETWTDHTAAAGVQPGGGEPSWPQSTGGATAPTGPAGVGGATGQAPSPWLWQSIVATFLCCLPAGVVGIVFAVQSQSAAGTGDLATATRKARLAQQWTIASVVLGLVAIVLGVVLVLAGSVDTSTL